MTASARLGRVVGTVGGGTVAAGAAARGFVDVVVGITLVSIAVLSQPAFETHDRRQRSARRADTVVCMTTGPRAARRATTSASTTSSPAPTQAGR